MTISTPPERVAEVGPNNRGAEVGANIRVFKVSELFSDNRYFLPYYALPITLPYTLPLALPYTLPITF